jgi:hypothetical protein
VVLVSLGLGGDIPTLSEFRSEVYQQSRYGFFGPNFHFPSSALSVADGNKEEGKWVNVSRTCLILTVSAPMSMNAFVNVLLIYRGSGCHHYFLGDAAVVVAD